MEKSWSKGADLALKFLPMEKATAVVQLLGPKFMQIQKHSKVSKRLNSLIVHRNKVMFFAKLSVERKNEKRFWFYNVHYSFALFLTF